MTKTSYIFSSATFNAKIRPLTKKNWLWVIGVALVGSISLVAVSALPPPPVKALALSPDPLFAASAGDKPVIALALSVEFPTVGAQYPDATYDVAREYLGYYDAESCYSYNKAPTDVATTAINYQDYKRFDRIAAAAARKCAGTADGFSGNFLNFASSSSIDMLRLALSGGDRLIDTGSSSSSMTILQRAVLPNGDPSCFWNSSSNFQAKNLPKDGGNYLGAVPTVMRIAASASIATGADILVANTLNRIYFGVSKSATAVVVPTSGCGDTNAYNLSAGAPPGVVQKGPQTNPGDVKLPSGAVLLGGEGATYTFVGTREIWFGLKKGGVNYWTVLPASGGIDCYWTGGGGPYGGINDPRSGEAKECFSVPYTGSWTPTAASSGLNNDGFFFARVQVCNVDASKTLLDVRDYGLCTRQPNGFYKPTGSIQKYSDQLRLSAFGYLMDQTNSNAGGRYGGVLRAPMKYVGAKTFDINGVDNTPGLGNPNAEWNPNTGVFTVNPDGDTTQATPISGVINYLNKFGRTGPTQGRYKIYDPVGELYGEALRYLQGLGPTAEAVSGLSTPTDPLFDGFPAYTSWSDPYGGARTSTSDYSCLKSNIVMIGDVNAWDSNRLLTRTPNVAGNLPNFNYWKSVVDGFESNAALMYTDGQAVNRTTGNPNTANTNAQTSVTGNTPVTGLAYWAHTQDIRGTNWTANVAKQRPGLRVKSFFFDVNEGRSSDSAFYRQNQNQFFTASKYGGFETDADNAGAKPFNNYGNPFRRQDGTADNNVWQDPARPGEASTHYLSSSARETLNAFDNIFSRAATSARSIAKSAVSNKNLTTAGSTIYQGAFDTSDWSGDVLSLPISLTGTSTISLGVAPNWSAATVLALTSPASRTIVMGRTGTTANPTATPFLWASLDTAMQANLSKLTPATAADAYGADRVNYLRGDRSKEGAPFRTRNKLLGDVVNSGIVFSGKPTSNILPLTTAYQTFLADNSSRTSAIFVGANDGMLHAFNATTGAELFGYIPSWMGPKLAALSANSYNANHQAYVDATSAVAEAQVGSANTAADWKTVLVSGTGAGGPGVFALDVTDPTAFSASKVMWEFTKDDDVDMGYVVGRPRILKLRTSAPATLPATYRWFAVVASGVNNYLPYPDAAGTFSATGSPALFLLALDKPVGTAWTSIGSTPNYYKLTVPTDSTLIGANATGLINFEPTFGNGREVAQIYMGDFHGKVWRLDFTQRGAANWTFNELSYYKTGPAAPYPLYTAKTNAGLVQPITMPPTVVAAGSIGGVDRTYVTFGTGKYLETSDKVSTAQNSFYVIYEDGSSAATAGGASVQGRGRLQAGTINTTTFTINVPAFKFGKPSSDTDLTRRAGWFIDYVAPGEKSISAIGVSGDFLVFGSVIPLAAGNAGACAASGGGGNVYDINVDTGAGTFRRITTGIFGEQLSFDTESATTYTISDSTGRRIKTVRNTRVDVTSGSLGIAPTKPIEFVAGRLSWRQINNYQDLKNP